MEAELRKQDCGSRTVEMELRKQDCESRIVEAELQKQNCESGIAETGQGEPEQIKMDGRKEVK